MGSEFVCMHVNAVKSLGLSNLENAPSLCAESKDWDVFPVDDICRFLTAAEAEDDSPLLPFYSSTAREEHHQNNFLSDSMHISDFGLYCLANGK